MDWRRWTQNPAAKLLSFVVAVGVWLSVTNRAEFEQDITFPIEYVNRPAGLTSIEPLPEEVKARVRGKGKFLRYTLRNGTCRVDLSGYQTGQSRIVFSGEDVAIPDDVEVSRVEILEPRRIVVDFDETVVRDIAITPTVIGAPDSRYIQVGKTFLSPAMARVKGPRRLVDEIALLATREIDISQKRGTVRKRVRLVPIASRTVEVTPMTVDVGITIEPLVVANIETITLVATNGAIQSEDVEFSPQTVAVEIQGARSIAEVAAKEVSTLMLHADHWPLGPGTLQFREFRGRDIVFVLEPIIPDPVLPDSTGAAPATEAPMVGVEVVGRLPLPRDVDALAITPETLLVMVTQQTLVQAPPGDEPGS